MKLTICFLAILITVSVATTWGSAATIMNRSFETDSPHPFTGPTDWVGTNLVAPGPTTSFTFVESAASPAVTLPYPEGSQALGFRHDSGPISSIHQDLTDLGTVVEGEYSISFFVADRTNSNWLNYRVELLAIDGASVETAIIDENSVTNAAIRPVNGSTSQVSPYSGVEGDWLNVILNGNANAGLVGQTLRVRFSSSDHSTGDNSTHFDFALDDVSFDVTPVPEPSSIILIVFGIGLISLKRIHRNRN